MALSNGGGKPTQAPVGVGARYRGKERRALRLQPCHLSLCGDELNRDRHPNRREARFQPLQPPSEISADHVRSLRFFISSRKAPSRCIISPTSTCGTYSRS